LAVCGAHLAGQPLNPILLEAGARLHARTRTAAGYRMVCVAGSPPRPGLIDDGTGPDDGLEVELWNAPLALVQQLAVDVASPLQISTVRLANGAAGLHRYRRRVGRCRGYHDRGRPARAFLAATES
jgi:allophanate hydrolase